MQESSYGLEPDIPKAHSMSVTILGNPKIGKREKSMLSVSKAKKDWFIKNYTALVWKYTTDKKFTISLRFGWNFSNFTHPWANHFDKVWWGLD